jgi:hypothetical protein
MTMLHVLQVSCRYEYYTEATTHDQLNQLTSNPLISNSLTSNPRRSLHSIINGLYVASSDTHTHSVYPLCRGLPIDRPRLAVRKRFHQPEMQPQLPRTQSASTMKSITVSRARNQASAIALQALVIPVIMY